MKKLLFSFVLITVCSGISLYLEQSYASSTLQQLKPKLSEYIASSIEKKASLLFSFIPARSLKKGVWTALGWGFDVLKPQLETTKWAGEKVQAFGKSGLTTAGLATAGSSLWFVIALVNQIKKFREVNQRIRILKEEIEVLNKKKEETTEAATAEENLEEQLTQKEEELRLSFKKASFLQRFVKIVKAVKLPGILALIAASQVSQSYGQGYTGSWLEYIGRTLGQEWRIPIK